MAVLHNISINVDEAFPGDEMNWIEEEHGPLPPLSGNNIIGHHPGKALVEGKGSPFGRLKENSCIRLAKKMKRLVRANDSPMHKRFPIPNGIIQSSLTNFPSVSRNLCGLNTSGSPQCSLSCMRVHKLGISMALCKAQMGAIGFIRTTSANTASMNGKLDKGKYEYYYISLKKSDFNSSNYSQYSYLSSVLEVFFGTHHNWSTLAHMFCFLGHKPNEGRKDVPEDCSGHRVLIRNGPSTTKRTRLSDSQLRNNHRADLFYLYPESVKCTCGFTGEREALARTASQSAHKTLASVFDTMWKGSVSSGRLAAPVKQYTDDTAMTKCIAESLITQRKFDPDDLAKSSFGDQNSQLGNDRTQLAHSPVIVNVRDMTPLAHNPLIVNPS
uniref:Uncharacterized protein n=1 Tax=Timema cristinae TaxID=61476 RepID=A0A7R9GP50_TIMCR|nr:unnamed protein product [Timema cristinae]